MRRCQQYEVYAAESTTDPGKTFSSLEEIERWVNGFRESWWWNRFYRNVFRIEVSESIDPRASVGAWIADEHIASLNMKEVHWNEHYVLHELAHPLSSARFDSKSHDPYFARTLIELTSLVRGSDSYLALAAAFKVADIEIDHTDERELIIESWRSI